MLAAVLSALLLLPVIPPDPIVPPETWIAAGPAEGSSTGTTTASFTFGSDDPSASYRCELDGALAPCGETYTTPELGLGAHTLSVRASGESGIDRTPATRNWTVIHVDPEPSPTPTPTPSPEPTATPTPPPAPDTPPTVQPSPDLTPDRGGIGLPSATTNRPIDISIVYFMNAKKHYTRFATLTLKRVPAGASIAVACKGGCPRAKQTLTTRKGGTVALTAWRNRQIKTGATLTITVTRPGMAGTRKTLTMRAERRPRIATKTLA